MGYESVRGTGRRGKIGGTSVRGYQRRRDSAPRRGRGLQHVHGTRSSNPITVVGFLAAAVVVALLVPGVLLLATRTSPAHHSETAPSAVQRNHPGGGVFPHSPPRPAPPPPPCYPLQVGC
ncbi:hypothetical protein [Nocardia wallacei]|uniref:hypothetical protein n=1 Tax=Nocardia wallacei TaxID=480035 RepID=UPI0024559766|nr:hypothetical protein [Nocardia wallacei]